ncbi:MFS transporter [Enteractinococcus coprophilus]|uniref:Putative MFS family arabinose efflux permease n=1 Tax=Enteractinococcus coprophilus TaxID=1027633 RepID=A0A543AG96_9MICC|nr:MFS transporter [Enteractinococcus coprophilus]TQL71598.1 putative MFS family arabinose efflux permease [Enteractinococcus coprophilus]
MNPSTTPQVISHRGAYVMIAAFSAVMYAVLLTYPAMTDQLIEAHDMEADKIGLLFSVEMGVLSLATLPAYLWLKRVSLVPIMVLLTTLMVFGNILSSIATTFGLLASARGLTALAAGSMVVVILAFCRRMANSSRALGIWVTAQLAMAAVMLGLYPWTFARMDLGGVYLAHAGIIALCLLTLPSVRGISFRDEDAGSVVKQDIGESFRWAPAIFGLAAILIFYASLHSVWALTGLLASAGGISADTTSLILSFATIAGVASALLATLIGDTKYRSALTTLGLGAMAISVLLFIGAPHAARFALAAILFKFAWTFALPFIMASLADLPRSDQVMNSFNLMNGIGGAIGPALGGILVARTGSLDLMLVIGAIGLGLTIVCTMVLNTPRLRKPKTTAVVEPEPALV